VDFVVLDVGRDVVDELSEESNLGQLVEGNEPQTGEGVALGSWRWASVGKTAMRLLLDCSYLCRGGVGETVAKRKGERCSGGDSRKVCEANQRGRGDVRKHYDFLVDSSKEEM
jgi:hypothetical protein